MADLEAVLADVSYLMAMEMSKSTPAARASKKITLPDASIRSVMMKFMEKRGELTFDNIFNQRLGYLLFKDFCLNYSEVPVPQIRFYEEIRKLESLETDEERITLGKEIYDQFIMKDLLSHSHDFSQEAVSRVLDLLTTAQRTRLLPNDAFSPYIKEICDSLRGSIFEAFVRSSRYAMKCLDKKRIKIKGGESLALNERAMLSLVSTGEGCPFIVCMTYAFQTPEKLCFILDLMNGGDLHYHLTQHNVFSESEVRFYASEVILGLEHMHNRFIVYRDLKPANILLDEHGHVRISDLGLACDFSRKRPHASVGTHGYMAPEVLQRGRSYDSSADWFSFGCMLYKLLRGHSPFRHHKVRDKHEIDRMTMTMDIELPDDLSPEMYSLLSSLLARDVDRRMGCMGRGSLEVREHPFFRGIDWQMVYLRRYPPPLVPPRGEVNAADAFDIGSFDEEDTKYIKLISMFDIHAISPAFQRMYKMDNCLVISLKNDSKLVLTLNDKILITQWKEEIEEAFQVSTELISALNRKAHKMYGAETSYRTYHINLSPAGSQRTLGPSSPSFEQQSLTKQCSVPLADTQKPIPKFYSITTSTSGDVGVIGQTDRCKPQSESPKSVTENTTETLQPPIPSSSSAPKSALAAEAIVALDVINPGENVSSAAAGEARS
nr:unnamed protein product [Spirometra erinaceieuropaei]